MKKKQNTKPTKQDIKDWQSFIKNLPNIENKDSLIDNEKSLNFKKKIFDLKKDLHGLNMQDALNLVSCTLDDAIDKKLRKVLFITGKGLHSNKNQDPYSSSDLSLLRYAVPQHINKNYSEYIIKIEESPKNLGGSGSIIVFLKKL